MLFSTKAEYGVRLMVELGRQGRDADAPVPLSVVAESEGLPLSYLEHLVARLRKAELVASRRGAHGGYRLARPASEITMDEIVQVLEGAIVPMECFTDDGIQRVLCSHEGETERACATRLLWTRVQGGMIRALQGTTLQELVDFAERTGESRREPAHAQREATGAAG